MEQKSEKINLEYIVGFLDGLRPRVHVYGIDSEAGETYGAQAWIGVSVGAGHHVNIPSEDDFRKRHVGAMVSAEAKIDASLVVLKYRTKLSKVDGWEQKMLEVLRKDGWNGVKIQNPEHIKPAIDRHVELYIRQFHELAERFENLFQGFIGEHPGYGRY